MPHSSHSSTSNRNRQNVQSVSTGSLLGAAVGLALGVVAIDHVQSRHENRESIVQGLFRWVREDVLELPSHQRRPRLASQRARRILTRADIRALPVRILGPDDIAVKCAEADDEKTCCAVCRDTYQVGDQLMRLPCFHEFHVDCISEYLETTDNPVCPLCRHPVLQM